MPGSDFQILLLPFLENLKEGEEYSMENIKVELIKFIELTDKELKPFDLEKDEQAFQEAVKLTKEHLTKAGLVADSKKDHVRITSFGKMVLSKKLNSLDINYLRRLPGYN